MDTIFQKITEWLKEMLVSGIMESLSGMFDSVNQQVSDVAAQVGTSPVNFSPGVFAMIRNVSECDHPYSGADSDIHSLL